MIINSLFNSKSSLKKKKTQGSFINFCKSFNSFWSVGISICPCQIWVIERMIFWFFTIVYTISTIGTQCAYMIRAINNMSTYFFFPSLRNCLWFIFLTWSRSKSGEVWNQMYWLFARNNCTILNIQDRQKRLKNTKINFTQNLCRLVDCTFCH